MRVLLSIIMLSYLNCNHRNVFEECFSNIRTIYSRCLINPILKLNSTSKIKISESCSKNLHLLIDKDSHELIEKSLLFSGRTTNDISSDRACKSIEIKNKTNTKFPDKYEMEFILVSVKKNSTVPLNSLEHNFNKNSFYGICFKKGCSISEYQRIFYFLGKYCYLLDYLNVTNLQDIEITRIDKINDFFFEGLFGFQLIPFFVLIVFILFSCFPLIPAFMFRCCFKIKVRNNKGSISSSENQIIKSQELIQNRSTVQKYDLTKIDRFKNCFIFSKNQEEMFFHKTNYYNDTGLSFVRGLNAISCILYAIAKIYTVFINSPLKQYCELAHLELINSWVFSFIFIGMRTSPKMILALSGLVLTHKLINYLENQRESYNNPENSLSDSNKIGGRGVINFALFIKFIFSHSYLYFIYLFYLSFFYFSFYYVKILSISSGPMWVYFNKFIFNYKNANINFLKNLTLVNCFWEDTPFSLIQLLFIYFIFTSAIIFLSYRFILRFDIFLICTILLNIFARIFIYMSLLKNMNISSTIIGGIDQFSKIQNNPLFNYSSFLIGSFFGLLNYIVQMSIGENEVINSQNNFLKIPFYVVSLLNKNYSKKIVFISIISISYVLFDSFSLWLFNDKIISPNYTYLNPKMLTLFYLVDCDIFVFIFLLLIISLTIGHCNLLLRVFTHKIWIFLNRIKYNFIVISILVSYYAMYSSDDRIDLQLYVIILFSIYNIVLSIFISIIFYLIFEVPLKKISKNILQPNEKSIDYEDYADNKITE